MSDLEEMKKQLSAATRMNMMYKELLWKLLKLVYVTKQQIDPLVSHFKQLGFPEFSQQVDWKSFNPPPVE